MSIPWHRILNVAKHEETKAPPFPDLSCAKMVHHMRELDYRTNMVAACRVRLDNLQYRLDDQILALVRLIYGTLQ